jgi:crotonobetainyl-CoA:carnitine CoA-transferase CaiB-like acyl-CoA transferase
MADREDHHTALDELISVELARYPGEELVVMLHAQDVPCALIRPVDQVHLDPQVRHNEVLVEHERPWIGLVREPRPAPQFDATPAELGRHAPRLDEHTDEVLASLGCDDAEIARLRSVGVAGPHK